MTGRRLIMLDPRPTGFFVPRPSFALLLVMQCSRHADSLLNIVAAFADYRAPVRSIEQVLIDGERLPIGTGGHVVAGRFAGLVKVGRHIGDGSYPPFAFRLWEEVPAFDVNALRNVPSIYLQLAWSPEVFPDGVPVIEAVVDFP